MTGLCQPNFRVAELVKSFEPHRKSSKVLTTSATLETLILNCNAALECRPARLLVQIDQLVPIKARAIKKASDVKMADYRFLVDRKVLH